MVNKRKKGLVSTLGMALVAMLAFSALAAGSAQAASWHVKGESYSGEAAFTEPLENPGALKMDVPAKKLIVNCQMQRTLGKDVFYESTKLRWGLTLLSCSTFSTVTNETDKHCIQAKPVVLLYEGTGASVSTTEQGTLEFEKEKGCSLALKNKLVMPTISLSYGPEQWQLHVSGSGSGTFGEGLNPMSVSFTSIWPNMLGGGPAWGWY